MFRLLSLRKFSKELSENPELKFKLVWLTFGGLFLPTAFLMSLGFPEKYALPLMLVAIPPFQYVAFCILKGLNRSDATVVATGNRKFRVLDTIVGVDAYYQPPESPEEQLLFTEYSKVRAKELEADVLQAQIALARATIELERSLQDLVNLKVNVIGIGRTPPDLETKLRRTLMQSWIKRNVSVATIPILGLSVATKEAEIAKAGKESQDTLINLQRKPLEMRPGSTHLRGMLLPSPVASE